VSHRRYRFRHTRSGGAPWYTVQFDAVDGGATTVVAGADAVLVARCAVELGAVLHPAAMTAVAINPTRASEWADRAAW
jgi:hypothetical protein